MSMKKLFTLLLLSLLILVPSYANNTRPLAVLKITDAKHPMQWPFKDNIKQLTLWCFDNQVLVLFDMANQKNWPLNDIAHKNAKALALEPSINPILKNKDKELEQKILELMILQSLKHCP